MPSLISAESVTHLELAALKGFTEQPDAAGLVSASGQGKFIWPVSTLIFTPLHLELKLQELKITVLSIPVNLTLC